METQGKLFRQLIQNHPPLQILGSVNAYSALLAQQAGGKAIYLSGAGVANASYGLPDLGMTSLPEVLEDAQRITDVCDCPLLVDVDTGWGHIFNIARTVKQMERARVAAIHIEDQVVAKRCGHRPQKQIVSCKEMGDRIKAAVDARVDDNFVIMARTDAFANEGMQSAVERAHYYVECGADMLFPEALTTLEEYQMFGHQVSVPVLANITEFGNTPLFSREELAAVGIQMILYPLSAFRAMAKAALDVYQTIVQSGTQKTMLSVMQTREELYATLNYYEFEKTLNQLIGEQDVK